MLHKIVIEYSYQSKHVCSCLLLDVGRTEGEIQRALVQVTDLFVFHRP